MQGSQGGDANGGGIFPSNYLSFLLPSSLFHYSLPMPAILDVRTFACCAPSMLLPLVMVSSGKKDLKEELFACPLTLLLG